jgi:hypothetical protein
MKHGCQKAVSVHPRTICLSVKEVFRYFYKIAKEIKMNERVERKSPGSSMEESLPDEVNLVKQTTKLFNFIDDFQQIHIECAENIIVDLCGVIRRKGLIPLITNFRIISEDERITKSLDVAALLISTTAYSNLLTPVLWRGLLGLLHSVDSSLNPRMEKSAIYSGLKGCLESNELYTRYIMMATSDDVPVEISSAFLLYIKTRYKPLKLISTKKSPEFLISQELIICDAYERLMFNGGGRALLRHAVALNRISSMKDQYFTKDAVTTLNRMFLNEKTIRGL